MLILLGHENEVDGTLSEIAKARCERALEIGRADTGVFILPTGAFGRHFNRSLQAHGLLLRQHLVERGFPRDRILPATNSSGTLEDALCARKVVIDQDFKNVIALSSDYHMRRVRYILGRVFQDLSLNVSFEDVTTDEGSRKKEACKEEKSLNRLIDEWVNIPLYFRSALFPEQAYENAAAEQKHYDTISLALVTGILGVSTFPYFAKLENLADFSWAAFLLAACINLVLLLMYERAAETARTARRLMQYIEVSFDARGFSSNYVLQGFYYRLPGMKRLVRVLSIGLIIILLLTALYLVLVGAAPQCTTPAYCLPRCVLPCPEPWPGGGRGGG